MLEFWESLKAVSATGRVVVAAGVILGVVYFFLERRERKLEERLKRSRRLSPTQREALIKSLRDCTKGLTAVNFRAGDSEAADYATEFKSVFEAADTGVMEFRELMLPYIVMADGMTISERVLPMLDGAVSGKLMLTSGTV